MTEEMKSNDATRFFVVKLPDCEEAVLINEPFGNEADARKRAEDLAVDAPGVEFAVFQKIGSTTATLKAEWKGAAR